VFLKPSRKEPTDFQSMPKIDPKIKITNNRIQLQFTYPSKVRHCFSVGLEDDRTLSFRGTPVQPIHDSINLRITRGIIAVIKRDVLNQQFDFSTQRYRYRDTEPIAEEELITEKTLSMKEIWLEYCKFQIKTNQWEASTHHHYQRFTKIIESLPSSLAYIIHPNRIQEYLLDKYSQEYSRRTMMQLNAACNWASLQTIEYKSLYRSS
jgi:hypothetical protein